MSRHYNATHVIEISDSDDAGEAHPEAGPSSLSLSPSARRSTRRHHRRRGVSIEPNGPKDSPATSDVKIRSTDDEVAPTTARMSTRRKPQTTPSKRKASSPADSSDNQPPSSRTRARSSNLPVGTRISPVTYSRKGKAKAQRVDPDSDDSVVELPPASRLRRPQETLSQRLIRRNRMRRLGEVLSSSDGNADSSGATESDAFIDDDEEEPERRPHGGDRNQREAPRLIKTPGRSSKQRYADPDEEENIVVANQSDGCVDDDQDEPEQRPRGRNRAAVRSAKAPRRSPRQRYADPDEEENVAAETEDEDASVLQMDEPERFETSTRLRQRAETAHQRMLRKLRNRRLNIDTPETEEEGQVESVEQTDWVYEVGDTDGFITDDGDEFDSNLLPDKFSLGYAQSKEYKFKVVFQYLLLLVINGPDVLPLRGANKKHIHPVLELRDFLRGIRNLRVRSQIWRPEFVEAMEKYPDFISYRLAEKQTYCDACNRRNQHCWDGVTLKGTPYNPESHVPLDCEGKSTPSDGDDQEDDDAGSDEDDDKSVADEVGPLFMASSRLFHALSHWEHNLFLCVQRHYHDLLRAKGIEFSDDSEGSDDSEAGSSGDTSSGDGNRGRFGQDHGARRRRQSARRVEMIRDSGDLPDEGDLDTVNEWMEQQGYQDEAFKQFFTDLEDRARTLGGDDARAELEEFDHM